MQISKQVFLLKHDFEVVFSPTQKIPRFVYSLVLFGDSIILIDAGVKGSEKAIFDCIQAQGRSLQEVKYLFLSHAHPDHIGAAAKIKAETGCTVLAHAAEQNWIENIQFQSEARPVPGFFNLVESGVTLDGYIGDGDHFPIDSQLHLKILHTPGHSPGSLSFLFPEIKTLFTADAVAVAGDIPTYDNYFQLKDSLEKIKKIEGLKRLLTSWCDPLESQSVIQNFLTQALDYLMKLDEAVQKNYLEKKDSDMNACKQTITSLGMPPFYANALVHRAFLSHFEGM